MENPARYQPEAYNNYRPAYPAELFRWLTTTTTNHDVAWDCATGNGQSARGLVPYYSRIFATDIDAKQIKLAEPHQKITYRESAAEKSSFENSTFDLVTVGCAAHWFDLKTFYKEVNRVLRPKGVLAVWTYEWPWTGKTEVDEILRYYKEDVLGAYWAPGSKLYFEKYQNLEFPFDEFRAPSFFIRCKWNSDDVLRFLSTWVGPRRYTLERGEDPGLVVKDKLSVAWNNAAIEGVALPIYMRIGRRGIAE